MAIPLIPAVPSVADLYGTSIPVARVVALPVDRIEPVMVLPVDPDSPPPRRRSKDAPDDTVMDALPADDNAGSRRTPFWMHLLPLGFLCLCLLVPLVRDLMARHEAGDPGGSDYLDPKQRIALHFHDKRLRIALGTGGVKPGQGPGPDRSRPAFWEPSMRFGLEMLDQPDPTEPRRLKRLTFERDGLTNNTVVKLDGNEWVFGDRPFVEVDGRSVGEWPGRWLGKPDEHLPETAYSVSGRKSVWIYDAQKVEITQFVEIVRGAQSNLLDTCLVRYRMENKDHRPHLVGLRFMLDTFIGSNDGVPFLIPGATALCDTDMKFKEGDRLPDFIQACEHSDLSHPGTIAQVGLKVAGIKEMPSRVTLGAWPNTLLERLNSLCNQEKTLWEVPVLKIGTLPPGDSAVTIYWNPVNLLPKQVREVGFSYGLGNVSSGEGAGKLAVTVGGSFCAARRIHGDGLRVQPRPGSDRQPEAAPGLRAG